MKYFKLIISGSKEEIVIDEDDFRLLKEGLQTGSFVKTKKAIINPSFVIAVLPTKIEKDTQRLVKGRIDEDRGVYVIEEDREIKTLRNEFQ